MQLLFVELSKRKLAHNKIVNFPHCLLALGFTESAFLLYIHFHTTCELENRKLHTLYVLHGDSRRLYSSRYGKKVTSASASSSRLLLPPVVSAAVRLMPSLRASLFIEREKERDECISVYIYLQAAHTCIPIGTGHTKRRPEKLARHSVGVALSDCSAAAVRSTCVSPRPRYTYKACAVVEIGRLAIRIAA